MNRTCSVLVAILLTTSTTHGQDVDPPHNLVRVPRSVPSHIVAPHGIAIVRSRLVEIELGPLGRARGTKDVTTTMRARLHLDLFDGAQHRATLRSVTLGGGGGQVFEGDVDGDGTSSVTLAVLDGQMFGNVKTGRSWYQIRYAGEGLHAVVEMDQSAMPPSLEPLPAEPGGEATAEDQVAADDGSIIDVLVMYTPSMKTAVGGDAGVANLINTAIAETNLAYQQSGVTQRLRLVHTAQTVNWLSNGTPVNADSYAFGDALAMLQYTSDGIMDEAHTLRNTYGADAVSLLINRGGSCGIAYLMRTVSASFAGSAFSVVAWDCATGYYSFGHELGHNMGLAHDRANAAVAGAFTYAYGWQQPTGAFRTIMAYNCPTSCTRVQYFSNPNVIYNGFPTGSPLGTATEAHNAQALNNTALTFSNFRASVTPTCAYTITPQNVAIALVGGSGTVAVSAAAGCAWTAVSNSAFVTVTGGATGTGNGTVSYSVAANPGIVRTGAITIAGETFTVTQAGLVPTGVVAEALSTTQVQVSWTPLAGATGYEIERRTGTAGFTFLRTAAGPPVFVSADPGQAYLYRVRAETPTGWTDFSAPDLATTVIFTDPALPSIMIKAVHLTELRTAVDAVRALAGMGGGSYTDSPPLTSVLLKADHVTELRNALDAARGPLTLSTGGYSGGATQGATVLAVHFQEIRDRVK